MTFSAVILAGGKSSRMGRDKAWVEVNGKPLLLRAIANVRAAGIRDIVISGRPDADYAGLNCPVLFDREPGGGPLAGIAEGLGAARSPLVLVLAVDLPQMTGAFLRKLKAHCTAVTGAVPSLDDDLEPLVAIYPARCHSVARPLLDKGRRAARAFAAICLREGAVRLLPVTRGDADCFVNCNTPADLAATVRKKRC